MPIARLIQRFLPYVAAIRGQALLNCSLLLLAPILSAALLFTFKVLVDDVLIAGHSELFLTIAMAYVLAAGAKIAVDYAAQNVEANAIESIVLALRSDLYSHALSLSPGSLGKVSSGDILARLEGDAVRAETLVYSAPIIAFADLASAVVYLSFLLFLNWQLAVCAMIALPIIVWIVHTYSPLVRKASRISRRGESHWMSLAEERLNALPVVHAFDAQRREERSFRHRARKVRRMEAASRILQARQSALVEATVAFIGLGVLTLGARLIAAGTLSIGELMTFIGTVGSLYVPVRSMAKTAGRFQHASAGALRVASFLDTPSRVIERRGACDLGLIRGDITFRDVTFAYPETGQHVLRGVSFGIAQGETVAVVGPSGSGKSSLVRLLMRQYDCAAGRITLDGHDIRELKFATLRRAIAPVFQDAQILNGTIERNIRYSAPGAPAAVVAEAARASAVVDFAKAKGGLQTPVGSRGSRLSGGQRQRVALARALLRDAPILILDEATAGVDSETEEFIQEALERLAGERTIIVVAHRLSTVRDADRVIVVEDGQVVEEGTPQDLLSRPSRCRKIFEAQLVHREAAE